ncbi:MAG: hypothetical protein EA401_01220 [Planctomycetota bacterium]|nr:MAG: hypothetical protein EA401_01220 [Planctomycetota bacterium]
MSCEWRYDGDYDACLRVHAAHDGRIRVWRGSYCSQPVKEFRIPAAKLQRLLGDLATALSEESAPTPPPAEAEGFIGEFQLPNGQCLRWHGPRPDGPAALLRILDVLDA